MAIESDNYSPAGDADRRENRKEHTDFSGVNLGTGSAPSGSNDLVNLLNKLGVKSIDSSVKPYLDEMMKLIDDNMPGCSLERLDRLTNSYAVKFNGSDGTINFFGLQFVSTSDPIQAEFYPASIKLGPMIQELRERYAGKQIRLVDARIILVGYEPEMSRFGKMADTIVRFLQVTSIQDVKEAQVGALVGTEFAADWRLSEARAAEDLLSPHGVRPRMDIGLTIKAKITNNLGREFRGYDVDYKLIGVIGGYVEIREKEAFTINGQQLMLYRPVFNITVCNSVIPLEGVGAILLAALAPTIYNTKFWAKQWQDLNDGKPNPGLLEEDPARRGQGYVLKDQEELLEFINTYFAPPAIAFQFQDGRDGIPGMLRLALNDAGQKAHFMARLAHFFGAPSEDNAGQLTLSHFIETRYDGVYGDPKGVLHDSREIDFLGIAAMNGAGSINADMRRILLAGAGGPTDRARLVSQATGSFTPLYLDNISAINPDFIRWIVTKTDAQRLTIVDPNSHTEARSFGSFLDGFGSTSNIGSIVTNGVANRGLNLSSVWQR
jgi:hypothetical protein